MQKAREGKFKALLAKYRVEMYDSGKDKLLCHEPTNNNVAAYGDGE